MNINASITDIQTTAQMIRDMLGQDFDNETFLDTLDGETDVMDMIGHLIEGRVEAKEIEAAMKSVAAVYTARAKRYAAQAEACTAGLGKLLDATGEKKIAHQMGTVSRTKPRTSMVVTDPGAVPSQLCKRVPDNAAIKAQLEAGEDVPGAQLVTGEAGLTVRVK